MVKRQHEVPTDRTHLQIVRLRTDQQPHVVGDVAELWSSVAELLASGNTARRRH